ncbi:MAG: ABC transporter substrate-binding protein [Bdellovibrionales bacterium]|nr:ABC transporter substrate-binding protein [Bdellovibrionales bacterium]
MKHIFCILILSTSVQAKTFKFSVLTEPVSLQNTQKISFSQNYIFDQLHSSLFRLNSDYSLTPILAKNCSQSKTQVKCVLKKNIFFSDGSPIYCQHFLKSFEYLIKNPNKNTERLSAIEGYNLALKNKNLKHLKATCDSNKTISFKLTEPSSQFLQNFTDYSTAPHKKDSYSGPYKLKKWELGSFILLTKNDYSRLKPNVSHVKIYFINNPSVALKMYEKQTLDLLTYLPTEKISIYKGKQQLVQVPMDRFDYIGIEKLNPKSRELITSSINYRGLQKLYNSKGMPGCPALSEKFFSPKAPPCLEYNPKSSSETTKLSLTYSLAGGSDISKGMQFIKNQVEKHTNIKINLNPVEPGQFISSLKAPKTLMYRRGVSLQLPRCYEAVEIFHSNSSRNYSKLRDKKLDLLIEQLRFDEKLCYKTVKYLLNKNYIVPLGPIHFSMLLNPSFSHLKINSLNQMDLSQLETN